MQETCHEVLDELGINDEPLLDLAMGLERIALEDEYFVEKKLEVAELGGFFGKSGKFQKFDSVLSGFPGFNAVFTSFW